jgi:hypothetical protein
MTERAPTEQRHRRDAQQHTKAIAERLGETEEKPLSMLLRVIEIWGVDFAYEHLERAEAIQRAGGLLTRDGQPRTFGGVFFYTVKNTLVSRNDARLAELWPSVWRQRGRWIVRALTALARKANKGRASRESAGQKPKPEVKAKPRPEVKLKPKPEAKATQAPAPSGRERVSPRPTPNSARGASVEAKSTATPKNTPAKNAKAPSAVSAPRSKEEPRKVRAPVTAPAVIVRRPRPTKEG